MQNKPKVKSVYPSEKPSFNDWCKMFNVSQLYVERSGLNNAQRIMQLWDGFHNTKQFFITAIKTEDV